MFAHSDVLLNTVVRGEAPVVLLFILFAVAIIAIAIVSHVRTITSRASMRPTTTGATAALPTAAFSRGHRMVAPETLQQHLQQQLDL